jgi:hypothetical protein
LLIHEQNQLPQAVKRLKINKKTNYPEKTSYLLQADILIIEVQDRLEFIKADQVVLGRVKTNTHKACSFA